MCTYRNLLGHIMLTKYITPDHSGLSCLSNITDSGGKNGITVIGPAVLGKKPNKSLLNSISIVKHIHVRVVTCREGWHGSKTAKSN